MGVIISRPYAFGSINHRVEISAKVQLNKLTKIINYVDDFKHFDPETGYFPVKNWRFFNLMTRIIIDTVIILPIYN